MSGLDGETRYACAAPTGVACDSVSGTYANAVHGNLPSQRPATAGAERNPTNASTAPSLIDNAGGAGTAPLPAAPSALTEPMSGQAAIVLRAPASVLRLWTKPWEDADGDLWDQGYVYVQVDNGRWQLDHVRQRILDSYTALKPPPAGKADPAESRAEPDSTSSPSLEAPARMSSQSPQSPFGGFPAFNQPPTANGLRKP
ncbi:TraV family lipoprotein [Pseudorhodoferax soli]|nr:TraV family lipoprotein [Pseudorhodoferax soli]